jgi:pentapeptide MXKDX repeat protein
MIFGHMSADQMSADQMSADQMSADQMSADQMSFRSNVILSKCLSIPTLII